jgi:hypothetical protein
MAQDMGRDRAGNRGALGNTFDMPLDAPRTEPNRFRMAEVLRQNFQDPGG